MAPVCVIAGGGDPVVATGNVPPAPTVKVAAFTFVIAGGDVTVNVPLVVNV